MDDPLPPEICAAHPTSTFGDGTAELLARMSGRRAVCVDPRRTTLDEMVDDLEAARERHRVERWTFWGMSGGTWIGLRYAQRHPEALNGLILESGCACFAERLADPACVMSPEAPAWRGKLPSSIRDGWQDVDGIGPVWAEDRRPRLVSPMPLDHVSRTVLPRMLAFDARASLPTLRTPTLVIGGDADPIAPARWSRALADALPNATWCLVSGGHVPTAQDHVDVRRAVRAFLGVGSRGTR